VFREVAGINGGGPRLLLCTTGRDTTMSCGSLFVSTILWVSCVECIVVDVIATDVLTVAHTGKWSVYTREKHQRWIHDIHRLVLAAESCPTVLILCTSVLKRSYPVYHLLLPSRLTLEQ